MVGAMIIHTSQDNVGQAVVMLATYHTARGLLRPSAVKVAKLGVTIGRRILERVVAARGPR